MKRLAWWAMAVATSAGAQTLEPDAQLPNTTREQAVVAARLVRAMGYRCDTVAGFSEWLYSPGYTLYCNGARYQYEIEDHGGQWRVTVVD